MPDNLKHMTDEELYSLLSGNNKIVRLAFEELYSRYATKIFTYCRKVLADEETAEDIFQETFVKLYESSSIEREMTNFNGFLIRICRNLCLNEKNRKKPNSISIDDLTTPLRSDKTEHGELKQILDRAIDSLPDEYREPIVLKEFFGLTYKEIASVTNTTLPVVRTRIWRAKSKLREIMAPYKEDYQSQ